MSLTDFASPWWLGFLVVVIALTVGYVVIQRRKQKHVLRFSNMELLESVAPDRPNRLRHLPTALVLVGLMFLTVALAGPTADQRVPRNRATVMLVIDVSLSMEATDVEPTRLAAAQEAAKSFADGLTPGINLGLVAFAGTASVLVSPTANREATKSAIDRLQLSERTATGESIFTSLQSIDTLGAILGGGDAAPPARIVLLSDGKQTVPQNLDDPRGGYTAARAAKDKNVPISTISFGTSYGSVEIEDENGVERVPVPVDDPSLREIANLSGGSFFSASSLEDLRDVYDTLEEQIGFEITRGDASRPWLILGVLCISVGLGSALVMRQRLP
ncbi:VWA domain-containing protein [Rhodococcus sp. IEGM 1401]|uniref:VWA domain-containing protein n=1 Tax=unclassified Rhodococcus (in: high G+C Gram-positive bacteria) TaxID=192944 RepID=UPI0022B466F0|nr:MULTISPECIES: VWA domain-containing protein [unclassified Rhodococcus (in: high G+C Gram-positive bacteria)]MCZ4560341.1 VWA domain-containing protein [Rhodococcus sp. IEGM 1401]MDI9920468.1 VWA domain-containing protein [Rhodococcus sp. IEGM 1372]MDV8032846.1 VWA domain-containing protein [Rhodococcus sp. IEGM 1414]